MTIREFIRQNREGIDREIRVVTRRLDLRLNDEERRLWVLNHEPLYLWAQDERTHISHEPREVPAHDLF